MQKFKNEKISSVLWWKLFFKNTNGVEKLFLCLYRKINRKHSAVRCRKLKKKQKTKQKIFIYRLKLSFFLIMLMDDKIAFFVPRNWKNN